MDNIVIRRTVSLDSLGKTEMLHGFTFTEEAGAHTFEISCTRDGSAVNLTGNCTAYFLRSDNETIALGHKAQEGDPRRNYARIENGKALVTLHPDCYNVPGWFKLSIYASVNNDSMCVYSCVGATERTTSETIVDSGAAIPNLNQLQNAVINVNSAIANAEAATTAAEKVNISQTKSGNVITVTTTDRNNVKTNKTITEPTATMSKAENGDYTITVKDANGSTSYTIEDTEAAVRKKATIEAVSKVKTALGNPLTITDGMDAPAVKTVVTLEPKQDLHGYDHPWVGGAGKNLLPQYETGGSSNGLTWVVKNDGRVVINGTATATVTIDAPRSTWKWDGVTDCWLSGCPAGGGAMTGYSLRVDVPNSVSIYSKPDTGAGVKFENASSTASMADSVLFFRIVVRSGTVCNNLTFAPQLEIGSAATTYEPYSNICPIEGYDIVRITATGKNLLDNTKCVNRTISGITRTVQQDKSIILDGVSTSSSQWYLSVDTPFLTLPPGTYTVSCEVSFRLQSTKNGLNQYTPSFTNGSATFTINEITTFNNARFDIGIGTTANNLVVHPQLECGSTATEYEPFGSTTSLSVAQAVGATVYGGTVSLNEDGSGTLVVDRVAKEYDGSSDEQWLLMDNGTAQRSYFRITLGAINTIIDHSGYSNILPATRISSSDTNAGLQVLNSSAFNGAILYVRLREMSEYTTVDAFRSYLASNPLQIVYKLSTPSNPIQLTADQLRTLTGENHVWTDGTKLELTYRADKYADVEKFLNAIPTGTKTGDPAVFADGADDLPFEKLTIAVEPHQEGSGDPSPDNVRPITGWDEVKVTRTGKNLFDPAKAKMVKVATDGTTRYGVEIDNLPSGTYIISVSLLAASTERSVFFKTFDGNAYSESVRVSRNAAGQSVVTIPTGTKTVLIYVDVTNVDAGRQTFANELTVMFEAGSTATAYEAPVSTTLSISLKYATGSTVYGGTVTINRDGTGSVVVDRAAHICDGTESIVESSATNGYMHIALKQNPFMNDFGITQDTRPIPTCSHYHGVAYKLTNDVGECVTFYGANMKTIGFMTTFSEISEFTDYLKQQKANGTPLVFVLPLATPTTYTLTAPQLTSLLGNNTVWCDAGQVTVKYKRDIGKMISNLYALMVDTGVIVIENEEDVTVEGPHYNP